MCWATGSLVLGIGVDRGGRSPRSLLPLLHFDFNPMHLRSAEVESVATLDDLMRDPDQSPNTSGSRPPRTSPRPTGLPPSSGTIPEVSSARTLSSFIPADQPEKIALIADAATCWISR